MSTEKNILVLGQTSQLAQSFSDLNKNNFYFAHREMLDLERPEELSVRLTKLYKKISFNILINTAAYTQVDKAENNVIQAELVNATSVGVIANWCAKNNVYMVHYSTDYVFSGDGENEWLETDKTAPLNNYGKTKLSGEIQMQNAKVKGLILRTSWVFSPYGQNFVKTMLRINKPELNIVQDQVGSPTYAKDLAQATLELIESDSVPFAGLEILNITNFGFTTWYEFARLIFLQAQELGLISSLPNIKPISSSDYKTPARRPLNSRLSHSKLCQHGIRMPTWQDGLKKCLLQIKNQEMV